MNEKLIRRAAVKYRDWLVSQLQSPIHSEETRILDCLHTVGNKVVQMETWANRLFDGLQPRVQLNKYSNEEHMGIVCSSVYEAIATDMIPELGEDITCVTQGVIATLESLATQKIITIISPREAIDEICAIIDAWPNVEFRNNILSVLIKNITLEDDVEEVRLGDFWMCVNLTRPLHSLRIKSVDNINSNDGYSHPHVSDKELCIGDGDLSSLYALCQGRLEDYFRIIEAVMRTYNKKSPYATLDKWYEPNHEGEFYCEECEEWCSDEDSFRCEGCEINYCKHCGDCCVECGKWYCRECSTLCYDCGQTLCHECIDTCSNCDNITCSSCLNECTICDNKYCYSCESLCVNCGHSVCKKCIATCKMCSDDICKECQTICDGCHKTLCNKCNNNSCEHCGINMCDTCKGEHNCTTEGITNE